MYGTLAPVIASISLAAYRGTQVKSGPWRGGLPRPGVGMLLLGYTPRAVRDFCGVSGCMLIHGPRSAGVGALHSPPVVLEKGCCFGVVV